ncbi:MAG: hypothetical protein QM679_13205, partial [Patulibacter sp.]
PPGGAGALPGGPAPWIAALRESYEEIGLLLATDAHGRWAHDEPARRAHLDQARAGVDAGTADFAELLAGEQLQLRVDRLRFVAHWVTPPGQLRRYDTRFYLAAAPPHAPVAPDGVEIVAADWVTPQAAIDAHGAGQLPMLPPTLGMLHWLAGFATANAALRGADALGAVPRYAPGSFGAADHSGQGDRADIGEADRSDPARR